jgi:putative ABC transport system ATP-binding protein
MVMVTHNANIAEMADTVVKLNSGRIQEVSDSDRQKNAWEIGW